MRCYGLDSPESGFGSVVGSCKYGNEPSGTIKSCGVLEYVSDC
jgi:hypothetical protein